jgi:hypothetical protein
MWYARQREHRYGRLNVNAPNFRAIAAIAFSAPERVSYRVLPHAAAICLVIGGKALPA